MSTSYREGRLVPRFTEAVIAAQKLACCSFSLFCIKGTSLLHTSNLFSLGSSHFNILLNSFLLSGRPERLSDHLFNASFRLFSYSMGVLGGKDEKRGEEEVD